MTGLTRHNEHTSSTGSSTGMILGIIAIVAVVVGIIYFLQEPRTMEERMDAAAAQLEQGNVGNAFENLGNETRGEQLQSDIENAVDATRGGSYE